MNHEIDLTAQFSPELNEIFNKLDQLEQARIYELSRVKGDGTLAHNVRQLRNMFRDLILKIEGKRPSTEEKLSKYFSAQ